MKVLVFLTLLATALFGCTITILTTHEYALSKRLGFCKAFTSLYKGAKAYRTLVVVSVMLVVLVLVLAVVTVSVAESEPNYTLYSVKQGDTVWNIAYDYYGEEIDMRKAVYRIEQINDIHNCNIVPGDIIKLPNTVR